MAPRGQHIALVVGCALAVAGRTSAAAEPPNHVAYAFPELVAPPLELGADVDEPGPEPGPESYWRNGRKVEVWPRWLESEYPLAEGFVPAHSSNFARGGMLSYDYIVVHTMEGYYAAAHNWFRNPIADVSAHFLMNADGETTQMVALADRAWHVGNVNPYAIGIEHEGFVDGPSWYTWETYQSSALLARWLSETYDIPRDRDHIVGHSELRGQTHHDPGEGWDWDLYMALIHDVVPRGELEGWVVDSTRGCTLTATRDAFVKATLEPASTLDLGGKCSVAAGETLTYLHASGELDGHLRLDYDADAGPCAGVVDLETQGYVELDAFTPACPDTAMAVAGVTVTLDGGARVVTDADGRFEFIEVEPGDHSLDVGGGLDYLDALALVDLDVYPGRRVVIALERPFDPDAIDEVAEDDECAPGSLDCDCDVDGARACERGLVCAEGLSYCVPAGDDPRPEGEDGGELADDGFGDVGGDSTTGEDTGTGGAGLAGDLDEDLYADGCAVVGPGVGPDRRSERGLGWLAALVLVGLGSTRRRRL